MQKEQCEKLKKIQLDMLVVFIEICKTYQLQYYLLGGTALGAVRNAGFIPWDDDIDVGLPREDYNKFIKIAQKELPHDYFLQNCYTDKEYVMNFSKIRNSKTTFIETSVSKLNINHGVYIDVFPLDGYSSCKFKQKLFNLQNRLLLNRIRSCFFFENTTKIKFKTKVRSFVTTMLYPKTKKAVFTREQLIQKYRYNDEKIVANYCGAWGKKEIMPRSWFGSGTLAKFENIDVIIPKEYDKYLTQLYGDYMTPPPKEEQVGHHYCTVIDLEKSYKTYIENNK